jgi:outer membrane protein assembly factor BamE (lipoprotein component of BamABCDE complex)
MHFFSTLLILTLLCGSCVMSEMTIGQPLESSAISQLQPNHSSAQDVADLLGAPNEVVELGNKSAWLYQAQKERIAGVFLVVFGTSGQDRQFDRCWVFFDENGLLTHIASSLESSTAKYNLSSSD